jgi:acylphosphatase
MDKIVLLRIEGRVQGVGYRAWAVREARWLGLAGWVRNRADRSVEVLIRGPEEAVDRFVEAARRGPYAAEVRAVRVSPAEGAEAPMPFIARATA